MAEKWVTEGGLKMKVGSPLYLWWEENQAEITGTKAGAITLPRIVWEPTTNKGDRHGSTIQRVVLHTWGVHYTDEQGEALSYEGVVRNFKQTSSQASAHFVFPGSAKPGEITQMVPYGEYAWAEAAYNPTSVEIENADAIWLGKDPKGLAELARITGYLLHKFQLPPVWSHDRGFCRHGDLGAAGGGHTACPTTNMTTWRRFVGLTQAAYAAGGYPKSWGR